MDNPEKFATHGKQDKRKHTHYSKTRQTYLKYHQQQSS